MDTFWGMRHNFIIILLILFWCGVRSQTCSNSTNQTTIKFTSYTDGSNPFIPYDVEFDQIGNHYLVYSLNGTAQNVHVTKVNVNGSYDWSKEYQGFFIKENMKTAQLSSNGTYLMIMGSNRSSSAGQLVRISTSDGSVSVSRTSTGVQFQFSAFTTTLSCSSNTDSICYLLTFGPGNADNYNGCKFDFNSTSSMECSDPDGDTHFLTSIVALNDVQAIIGGYDTGSTPNKFFFYSRNFNTETNDWVIESNVLEDTYITNDMMKQMSFLSDDSTKYYNILQVTLSPVVIILNPADGALLDGRKIDLSISALAGYFWASGRVSSNMIMVSFQAIVPASYHLFFINTDTWELTSYQIEGSDVKVFGFAPLFNTNQIFLEMEYSGSPFILQTAYDKLHLAEIFNQTTYTLTNVTYDFGFGPSGVSIANFTENTGALSVTVADITFTTDSSKTYEVIANTFSSSVATLTADTNSTTIGPLEFDCYSVTTSASSADFSNQPTLTQSDGQSIPSWMVFNSSSASISLTSPEVSEGNYTITNSYQGVVSNFTFTTNVTINITEYDSQTNNGTKNDDHCLNASSEGLCIFFVFLIVVGALGPIILIATLICVKWKCSKSTINRTRLDQVENFECNEGNAVQEDNCNLDNGESVRINQNPDNVQDPENGVIQHADAQENAIKTVV